MRRIAIALVTATLALSACGSSDKKDSTGSSNASETTKQNGSGTTAATTGDKGLDKLLAKAKTARYKVTYKNDNGDPITIVNDPPKAAFVNGDSGLYQSGDGKTVMCSGIGSEAACFDSPMGDNAVTTMQQGIFGAWAAVLIDGKSNGFLDVETSDKTVAGRDARCAHLEAGKLVPGEKGSVDICVDNELGITLMLKTSDGSASQTVLEATSVGKPSDSDTTPPATVQAMPGT